MSRRWSLDNWELQIGLNIAQWNILKFWNDACNDIYSLWCLPFYHCRFIVSKYAWLGLIKKKIAKTSKKKKKILKTSISISAQPCHSVTILASAATTLTKTSNIEMIPLWHAFIMDHFVWQQLAVRKDTNWEAVVV